MSINDTMTSLGDGFRGLYGTTDKYSVADMTNLLSGLEVHNFLDDGQYFDSTTDNGTSDHSKVLTGVDVAKWNKYLLGKTVIFSCDVEWSGFVKENNINNRVGYEFSTTTENNTHYNGTWLYPNASSGEQYCATEMTIDDEPINSISSGAIYDQINSDATVKITNVKMYIYPLGDNPS